MRRRALRLFFRLTRRRTRRRYGAEFDELLDELLATGEVGWGFLGLDGIGAVARDRLTSAGFRRALVVGVMAAALGVALWGTTATGRPSPTGSLGLPPPPPGPIARPLGLPPGVQGSATACPDPPPLSSALPPGDTISPPALQPRHVGSLASPGTTFSLASRCSYTVTIAAGSR